GGTLQDTGTRTLLANTQEHWSMEGRDIVREANYQEYQENPAFVTSFGMETHSPLIYGDMTPADYAKLSPEEKNRIATNRSTQIPRGNSLYETPKFGKPED